MDPRNPTSGDVRMFNAPTLRNTASKSSPQDDLSLATTPLATRTLSVPCLVLSFLHKSGRSFGCSVTHETKHLFFFKCDQMFVLLFCSPE